MFNADHFYLEIMVHLNMVLYSATNIDSRLYRSKEKIIHYKLFNCLQMHTSKF